MPPDMGSLEDFRRAEVEQEQLCRILQMKEHLDDFDTYRVLDQASLDSLGVVMGRPLDVDDNGVWDFSTSFFQTWVPYEVLAEAGDGIEFKWMDRYTPELPPAEWQYGNLKAEWFCICSEKLYKMDPSIWVPWNIDAQEIFECTGLDLPRFHEFRFSDSLTGEYRTRQYLSESAYFPVDESKPHIACCVIDSNDAPGDQVLRSDVDYAIALVIFRLQMGRHTGHHTKPGLIYTFERDQFARITQVHFDGKTNKLVLRQSRQLDLRGPEPTADAFLLLRWMANRPVGATEYVDEAEPEEEEATTPDRPSAAPKLLLGCA